ncbi:MAG: hypothetical protein HQK62_13650 [Desulfamplus sp.]|nr:hypothetical protein [Desulfamplus sp.]
MGRNGLRVSGRLCIYPIIESLIINTKIIGENKKLKNNVNDSLHSCTVTTEDDIHINDYNDCSNALIHEDESEKHKKTLPVLDFSEYDLQNLSIDDRDRIIFQVSELYPGRQHAQLRVDILNQNGVLFNGSTWTKKQFKDQLSRAQERIKIKQEK